MKPGSRYIEPLADRSDNNTKGLYQSMQTVKARIQIVGGLLAAVMVLVMACQAGDLNTMKEEMSLFKSISGWR